MKPVPTIGASLAVRWAPNGQSLYIAEPARILLVHSDQRVSPVLDQQHYSAIAISPDDMALAAAGKRLQFLSLNTGCIDDADAPGPIRQLAYTWSELVAVLATPGARDWATGWHAWNRAGGPADPYEPPVTKTPHLIAVDGHKNLLAGACPEAIHVWKDRKIEHRIPAASCSRLAIAPNASRLAATSPAGIDVWDLSGGVRNIRHVDGGPFTAIAWSRDSATLATAAGRVLQLWASRTHKPETLLARAEIRDLAFSPAADRLAIATAAGVDLLDV